MTFFAPSSQRSVSDVPPFFVHRLRSIVLPNIVLRQIALHSLAARMDDSEEPSIAELVATAEAVSEQHHSQHRPLNFRSDIGRGLGYLSQQTSLAEASSLARALFSGHDQGTGPTPLSPPPTRPPRFVPGDWTASLPFDAAYDHRGLYTTAMDPVSWPSRHGFGIAPQQLFATRSGTKEPVVTLDFQLPKTPYMEQDDPKAIQRTLAYVQVQRALLKYLDTHASEALSPRQATKWTQEIDSTGNREPKAIEALSLCYYMRAQGYEVLAKVRGKTLSLFCKTTIAQVTGADVLYWQQDLSTNRVEYATPSASRAAPRSRPRRTAQSHPWDEGEPMMNYQALFNGTTGRVPPPPPLENVQTHPWDEEEPMMDYQALFYGTTDRVPPPPPPEELPAHQYPRAHLTDL
jgi:hypothetical protein